MIDTAITNQAKKLDEARLENTINWSPGLLVVTISVSWCHILLWVKC